MVAGGVEWSPSRCLETEGFLRSVHLLAQASLEFRNRPIRSTPAPGSARPAPGSGWRASACLLEQTFYGRPGLGRGSKVLRPARSNLVAITVMLTQSPRSGSTTAPKRIWASGSAPSVMISAASSIRSRVTSSTAGDIDEEPARALRSRSSSSGEAIAVLRGLHRPVLAGRRSDTHDGVADALHHGSHVSESVDEPGHGDDVGDP